MEQRIYHGNLTPEIVADALVGEFHHGNLRVQQFGNKSEIVVQISTHQWTRSGGDTALTVNLRRIEDGLSVTWANRPGSCGCQPGKNSLSVWKNPFQILERLDDLPRISRACR